MPNAIRGVVGRLRGFWDAFSVPQRTFALIAVAAVILGSVVVFQWVSRPTMTPLYSGLSAVDAQAVVDSLSADGIPYQLAGGGGTVMVPSDQLYDLRVSLAAKGIPSQQDGYSLLDNMGMASTDFQQQITYQRALEGELAKTIQAMDGITTASVHLAMPEQSVFTDNATDPTASVFVAVATGKELDSSAVQAIQTLVAAGVPKMESGNVKVIDSTGKDLSTSVNGLGGMSTEYEQRTASQVQAMLDKVLGTGNAVVTVTAEMSTSSTDRVAETFGATDGVPPLSSSTTGEKYTGAASNAAGILGPDNIAVPSGATGTGDYQQSSETLNNAVDKVTESTTTGPGGLARQSVSVAVDATAARAISDADLRSLVAAAAGVDATRGDSLAVTKTNFDRTAADEAQKALSDAKAQDDLRAADAQFASIVRMIIIGGVAALVLVFLLVMLVIRRRAKKREELEAAEEFVGMDGFFPGGASVVPGNLEEDTIVRVEPMVADPDETMRADLAALAEEDPAAVAERLRDWLARS